tara:strand:- start:2394 stop:3392 length:999 start_codon:yes stop_codon:yes gene_type:complete
MTYIIAEVGVNHNGDINLAEKLIEESLKCGADAVKFQAWTAGNLVTKSAPLAKYQQDNVSGVKTQYEMLKTLELTPENHYQLKSKCDHIGIDYLCSAFDLEGLDLLDNLAIKKLKVPSGEITNLPYLRKVGSLSREVILSTGMSNLSDIERALDVITDSGTSKDNITILHCTTDYPADFKTVNLLAMKTISNAFDIDVGYSDHTKGIEVSIAAVAMGAKVIEKHITTSRLLHGPDHIASLEPNDFSKMVDSIRNIELAIGSRIKRPNACEIGNQEVARRSIVASCDIKKGDIFTFENLTTKRPGTGLSPMLWDLLIGTASSRNWQKDDIISM